MGNACVINVSIPLDETISCCWRRKCSTRESFQSLQRDWERLSSEKNGVLIEIELEEREHKKPLETVDNWLSRVGAVETKVIELTTGYSLLSDKWFCGYCPRNCKTIYKFWKDLADVREDVVYLLEHKPYEVTQESIFALPRYRPVGRTVGLQSMLDKVWKYFEDVQVGTIGLYGMGGVGKTTLLKEVNNKLCHSTQGVNVVILWIEVSTNPNLSIIQNDIGKKLGFHNDRWKGKSQKDKAEDIYNVLKRKKYVLFLDDLWNPFDLLKLGVPLPDQTNESKVVLTTRSHEVCCKMGVDKSFSVNCLEEEEAWNLFKATVGEVINSHEDIQKIAKVVAKECDGLPLALIVIGQTMSTKRTYPAWERALEQLKECATEFAGMEDQVLPLLKFSYNSIQNATIQSCFLYCSLYPKDYLISKKDIIDKWISEGFLDKFVGLKNARNLGYDYMDTLVNASLLEESSHGQIKMHDIIREMGIWIACECGKRKNKFFVRAGVFLTETPIVAEFEGSERISLMGNKIEKLTGTPYFPNLLTLFLNEAKLNHIDNGFFKSMPNLRVLDLSSNYDLIEITEEVCNLVTLQYLNLSNTRLSKLPINLHKLINLKWFSIQCTLEYLNFPERLLSSFKKLQVLNLYNTRVILPGTFVEELESLPYLNDLRIQLFNDGHFSKFSSSHKLASITTELCLYNIASIRNLDLLFSQKMVNLQVLTILICKELEYVISSEINGTSKIINSNYFQNLRHLNIQCCPIVKDIKKLTFAPNLESIDISRCEGMKELCGEWKWDLDGGKPTPFPKLKSLHLILLWELERIYPHALLFPCLKELEINRCPKLTKLPFNSRSCNSGNGVAIYGDKIWWDKLEWEDNAARIAFRHSFNRSSERIPICPSNLYRFIV